jgi:hypothetical protein
VITSLLVYGHPMVRSGAGGEPASSAPQSPTAAVSELEPGPPRHVTGSQAIGMTLLNELIPGILATMVVGGLVWNSINGLAVPQQLSDLCIAIAAFYFGVRGRGPVQVQLSR